MIGVIIKKFCENDALFLERGYVVLKVIIPLKMTPPSLMIPKAERDWAMFSHLSTLLSFLGLPLVNIIAPLVMWQMKKEEMPFGSSQAKECLNFQITATLAILISIPLCFVIIGFLFLIPIVILDLVFTIIAAVKANEGVEYRYPLTIRFIK